MMTIQIVYMHDMNVYVQVFYNLVQKVHVQPMTSA